MWNFRSNVTWIFGERITSRHHSYLVNYWPVLVTSVANHGVIVLTLQLRAILYNVWGVRLKSSNSLLELRIEGSVGTILVQIGGISAAQMHNRQTGRHRLKYSFFVQTKVNELNRSDFKLYNDANRYCVAVFLSMMWTAEEWFSSCQVRKLCKVAPEIAWKSLL